MKAKINRGNDVILSIGMIVKNEEKLLPGCLERLQPLFKAVNSELVIVDTGSTDKTVEIAKGFTDKVYHFDWVNDFSAARNFSLERCAGEWFMFLDADDYFDADLSEMTEFFNDYGKRSKYNTAYYHTRNYTDGDGMAYYDLMVERIARRENLRFVKPIHECFDHSRDPVYYFNTFANHYGYIYETEEQKKNKDKRNHDLLIKRLREEGENCEIYSYLIACSPDGEAEKYAERAVELARNDSGYQLAFPYTHAALFHLNHNREKAVLVADEYLGKLNGDEAIMVEIYAVKSVALYYLNRLGLAGDTLLEYFNYYDKFRKNKLDNQTLTTVPLSYNNKAKYNELLKMYTLCRLSENRFEEAYSLWESLELDGISFADLFHIISSFISITDKSGDYKRLAAYYNKAVSADGNARLIFDGELEKFYFSIKDKSLFARAFADNAEGDFAALMRLSADDNPNSAETRSRLQTLLDTITPRSGFSEAVYLAAKHKADLSAFIGKMTFELINELLFYASAHEDFPEAICDYCVFGAFTGSIKEFCFSVTALERAALSAGDMAKERRAELCDRFIRLTAIYVSNIYNPELFNEADIGALPRLHRFGYYAARGVQALDGGDNVGYIRGLTEAMKTYEEMKDTVTVLVEKLMG